MKFETSAAVANYCSRICILGRGKETSTNNLSICLSIRYDEGFSLLVALACTYVHALRICYKWSLVIGHFLSIEKLRKYLASLEQEASDS